MTEIVNGNKKQCDQWIDRRSRFGNPFKISDYNDLMPEQEARDLVVKLYAEYFQKRIRYDDEFREEVEKLKGKTLGCHCKPKKCHGDVIKNWLDGSFYRNGKWWPKPEKPELPNQVECPECGGTATQVDNDQLYKCNSCGYETVRIS